jgi:hypothetical protein
VAEDVMDDPKLVDDAAFLATEQRMRLVTRDRRERHRPVLAKLGTKLGCVVIGVSLLADMPHSNAKAPEGRSTADDLEQPRGLALECPVGLSDGVARRRRLPGEPVGDPLSKLGPQEARRSQLARRERGLVRQAIDLELCSTPRREHLTRRCEAAALGAAGGSSSGRGRINQHVGSPPRSGWSTHTIFDMS